MHQLSEASGRVPWPGGFSLSAAMHAVPKPLMEPPAALLLLLLYGPHCTLSMYKNVGYFENKASLRCVLCCGMVIMAPGPILISDAERCIHPGQKPRAVGGILT